MSMWELKVRYRGISHYEIMQSKWIENWILENQHRLRFAVNEAKFYLKD